MSNRMTGAFQAVRDAVDTSWTTYSLIAAVVVLIIGVYRIKMEADRAAPRYTVTRDKAELLDSISDHAVTIDSLWAHLRRLTALQDSEDRANSARTIKFLCRQIQKPPLACDEEGR